MSGATWSPDYDSDKRCIDSLKDAGARIGHRLVTVEQQRDALLEACRLAFDHLCPPPHRTLPMGVPLDVINALSRALNLAGVSK